MSAISTTSNINFHQPITRKNLDESPIPLWQHVVCLPISSQITVGLAKIFNFEILTHGTSFRNFLGILKTGGDPQKGGSKTGSTGFDAPPDSNMLKASLNHFYVFKDTKAQEVVRNETIIHKVDNSEDYRYKNKEGCVVYEGPERQYRDSSLCENLINCVRPRIHATVSGMMQAGGEEGIVGTAKKAVYAAGNFFFSPTLRFMYAKEEISDVFENDPDYHGRAYRTTQKVSNDRIGLIGVLQHASLEGVKGGLKERPLRVVTGVVQVIAGAALTYYGIGFFI